MNLRPVFAVTCACLSLALQPGAVAQDPPVIEAFSVRDSEVFLGGHGVFIHEVSEAANLSIDQGIGEVTGERTGFLQSEDLYRLPRGSTWRFLGDGSDQGSSEIVLGSADYDSDNWKHPGFDDSMWGSGAGELGYGDEVVTVVPFVDVDPETAGDQKNATTYFRTKFSISASEIADLQNLYLEMRRDDGAIVYLNGVEIARMNVGGGALEFDTYTNSVGQTPATGGGETTYFRCQLRPEVLTAGENTIAVEVHQVSEESSDMRFDFGLFQILPIAGETIFLPGSVWSYLDEGIDLGEASIVAGAAGYNTSNWKHPDFDDASWSTGEGDFGYDTEVVEERTVLRFGPNEDNQDNDASAKFATTYFRRTFELRAGELAAVVGAVANIRADDGAILYLNGVEVARDEMPEGEVTRDSFATGNGVNESAYDEFVIDVSALSVGINTVAVELHQASATSSDVSFDLEIETSDAEAATTRVARGSEWRYLDDGGASLGDTSSASVAGIEGYDASNWKHEDFDFSSWRVGVAEFGYGDTDLTTGGHLPQSFTTEISFGDDRDQKFVTTYFRREFDLTSAELDRAVGARFVASVDDGAIVFLNGVEIWRSNLSEVPVDGSTFADRATPTDGKSVIVVEFDPQLLEVGRNVIAVEVHQVSGVTSDAVFDLGMELVVPASEAVTYTLTATNEFGTTTASAIATTVEPPDQPIYLLNSNAGTVGWDFPEVWSDKLAPNAGDYAVYGDFRSVLRTPLNAVDPVFGGTSLSLEGSDSQLLLAHSSGIAEVETIFLRGGQIMNGVNRPLGVGGSGNALVVLADSVIGGGSSVGDLTVSANLSGGATLQIDGVAIFTGDNTAFSGDWLVDGVLAPASQRALGSGSIFVSGGGIFDPGGDFFEASQNPLLLAAGAELELDQLVAFESGRVTIEGEALADGEYSASDLDALGFDVIVSDGGGRLFIGDLPPDSDNDGLPDLWEWRFFTDVTVSDGSGDADGDGQIDAAEFVAGTSPVDPLDVFQVTSVLSEPGGGVTLTWPSKTGVSYGVRVGDLTNWTVLESGIAGNDAEMSYTAGGRWPAVLSNIRRITEAVGGVVVDHASGLHEGVADGWSDEVEASLFQVF